MVNFSITLKKTINSKRFCWTSTNKLGSIWDKLSLALKKSIVSNQNRLRTLTENGFHNSLLFNYSSKLLSALFSYNFN